MPQAKKDRGYSHWNPAVNTKYIDGGMKAALRVPRLIESRRQAEQCIAQWSANPNCERHFMTDWESGNTEETGTRAKDDGRKKEDLEVVEVDIIERVTGGSE